MNVIPTRTALPVRAWRWVVDTLWAFWSDFGDYVRREIDSCRRPK